MTQIAWTLLHLESSTPPTGRRENKSKMEKINLKRINIKTESCEKNCITYPEVLLQVVDCDWDVFAALFQLNVRESWKGEVQTQVLH